MTRAETGNYCILFWPKWSNNGMAAQSMLDSRQTASLSTSTNRAKQFDQVELSLGTNKCTIIGLQIWPKYVLLG